MSPNFSVSSSNYRASTSCEASKTSTSSIQQPSWPPVGSHSDFAVHSPHGDQTSFKMQTLSNFFPALNPSTASSHKQEKKKNLRFFTQTVRPPRLAPVQTPVKCIPTLPLFSTLPPHCILPFLPQNSEHSVPASRN